MEKNKQLNHLNSKNAREVFDYVLILILIFNLLYSLLYSLISYSQVLMSIIGYVVAPVSIILGVHLYFLSVGYSFKNVLTFKKINIKSIISCLLITLGLLFGLSELNNLFVLLLEKIGYNPPVMALPEKTVGNVIIVITFVCIIPAVVEEFFIRGIIVNGLLGCGNLFAILLSGAMFAMFHMSPQQTIYQFVVGCIYALIVTKGGSWHLTAIFHLINNLVIVLNEYFWSFVPSIEVKIVLTILGIISLSVGVLLLVDFKKEKPSIENIEERKEFFKKPSIGLIICIFIWIINLVSYL